MILLNGWPPTGWEDHPLIPFLAAQWLSMGIPGLLRAHTEPLVATMAVLALAWLVDRRGRRVTDEYELLFHDSRRIWSYHFRWIGLFVTISTSLWANGQGARHLLSFFHLTGTQVSLVLGLAACPFIVACCWLLVPGSRSQLQLLRHKTEPKLSHLRLRRGLPIPLVRAYYPGDVHRVQVHTGFCWLLTHTASLDLELTDGTTLRLPGPTSLAGLEQLQRDASAAIRAGKTVVDRPPHG